MSTCGAMKNNMVLFVFVFSMVHLSFYLMAYTAGFREYSTEKSIQNVLLRGMSVILVIVCQYLTHDKRKSSLGICMHFNLLVSICVSALTLYLFKPPLKQCG